MLAVLAAQKNDDLRADPPRQNHATNRNLAEGPRRRGLLEAAQPIERSDTDFVRLPSIVDPSHTDNRCTRRARARLLTEAVGNVENTDSAPQKPIEIYVSSPWSKRGKSTVPVRQDRRWAFVRNLITKVIDECQSRARASPGAHKLDIRLHRLRGPQGMNLLSTLRDRIERADALVMDLAGHNPNVLIEVGMAVALYKGESGALIILKPKNEPWPVIFRE